MDAATIDFPSGKHLTAPGTRVSIFWTSLCGCGSPWGERHFNTKDSMSLRRDEIVINDARIGILGKTFGPFNSTIPTNSLQETSFHLRSLAKPKKMNPGR